MTPERWQQIEAIFHETLELGDGERAKFVRERAGNDIELIAEVEKLLEQFGEASSFIEQPLYDNARTGFLSALFDDTDDDPMVGKVLGSYRIEREIGRGGMGAVYEALRADGEFRLRVAIKVVKRGIDTDFILKRFRNERQILAALDHPFITRLIDGGTTDDGRPYFVMEFIDGLPLYRSCDKNRLSINERLRLFCRISEAVEYAHQKLVIHRDLKPSNIFIANDGTPRLLDFGIAKLLDPEMASDTLQPTATALRMMTVDYASPEQIRGEKVAYATDVYSLGVILFELLTGHRPYKVKSRSAHDVARAICDDDPYLPSDAVTGNGEVTPVGVNPLAQTLTSLADLRRESPSRLKEQLRGSLDNIIIKALGKKTDQRYESVAAFRKDIERHLSGEPISLPSYYASASASRSPVPSGNESKLVAVLPLTLMNPSGVENTDEAYLTVGLADAIIMRLTSVKKLTVRPTSSITRYDEQPINPFRAGAELGVDFVLDGRLRRFGDRLRISLQLLDVKNITAIWAGQFDENLRDVLELEDAISEQVAAALIPQLTGEEKQKLAKRGTNDPQAYDAYLKGRFYWNQFTAQSLPKAIESFQRAIELDPEYALAYVGVADFYTWANIYGLVPVAESYELAGKAARRALTIDKDLGEAYASLALIVRNQFRYREAESLHKKAIELSPHYSLAREWYSALLIGTGRFSEGLDQMRIAEELDPLSLRTKTLVAWVHYQCGELQTALAKADEIISLDENYPQGHLQRGNILCELGRAAEAVESIERSMRLMPESDLAQFQYCLALSAAGRREEAVSLAEEMRRAAETRYVKPMFLCYAFTAAGELDTAFSYLETAIEEHDPWLCWLMTDPGLKALRPDPRFAELCRRTLEVGGSQHHSDRITDPTAKDVDLFRGSVTQIGSEMPTRQFSRSFVRRNYGKLAAAAVVLIGLFAAYSTGILTVSFRNQLPGVRTPATAPGSIAVLPFVNSTGDPANDYISDGMSEALISRMATLSEIHTVSRAATFAYRGKTVDPTSVGRELGVEAVLVGTLTRKEDEFTLRTDLIRVSDGNGLFTMFFVDKPDKILSLQDELISKTFERLDLPLSAQTFVAKKNYTDNDDAFQLYLKGEFSRQKSSPTGIQESIRLYEKALELDPNYALAFQGLSLAYRYAPAYGLLLPQDAYPKAKDAAQKALAIDPSLSTAYVSLASIKTTYDWDFEGAEREYKQAIQIAPNNSEAHFSYGNFLVAMGRTDDGLKELRIAQQIDPLSLNIPTNIGWALYIAGRYDEAVEQIRQVINRDPSFARAHMNLGEVLQEQGKFDEAIAELNRSRSLSQDPLADMALGHALAVAGRRAEATKIAVDLEEKVRQKQVSPFLPAVIYAGLNDKDKSFYWLERAYQERSNWLSLIKVGHRLKNLRGDPRFDDLLKRVGFTA